MPLDINVRAGSDTTQTDLNFNVSRLNASAGSQPFMQQTLVNLGGTHTPIDLDLKPQTVNEDTGGLSMRSPGTLPLVLAASTAPRARSLKMVHSTMAITTSCSIRARALPIRSLVSRRFLTRLATAIGGGAGACFGRARRYYRALEFTATKRFTNNWQFIASYVFSSLTGNYEGLFRNDNGQSDPNITSLFDLVSLLNHEYGRLPNDRPHQLKFDGSYRTPWKLLIGASFRAQSGIPFNQLIPHPIYGNNEGFGVDRGTAIVPTVAFTQAGFPNVVNSIGTNRTPTTWNLDLNTYYPIQFGENRQLRLQLDWFNVFNNQRAIRLDETYQLNSGITGRCAVLEPVLRLWNDLPVPVVAAFGCQVPVLNWRFLSVAFAAGKWKALTGRSARKCAPPLCFLVICFALPKSAKS